MFRVFLLILIPHGCKYRKQSFFDQLRSFSFSEAAKHFKTEFTPTQKYQIFNSLPFSRLSNLFFEIRSGWKMEAVGIYWKLGKKCVKAFTMNKVKRNDQKDRALEVNSWRGNNNISEENFEFSCWAKFSKGTYHKPWSDNIVLLYTRHRCQNCFSYRHWQQTPDYRYIFYLSVWEVLLGFTRT